MNNIERLFSLLRKDLKKAVSRVYKDKSNSITVHVHHKDKCYKVTFEEV